MAGASSPRPHDNDCLRLPATSSPRIRGAEKKESTGLRLNQPCPPYVTPSSISSFDRRLSSAHIAESKSLKNSGANTFCQSSARQPYSLAACFSQRACGALQRFHAKSALQPCVEPALAARIGLVLPPGGQNHALENQPPTSRATRSPTD